MDEYKERIRGEIRDTRYKINMLEDDLSELNFRLEELISELDEDDD